MAAPTSSTATRATPQTARQTGNSEAPSTGLAVAATRRKAVVPVEDSIGKQIRIACREAKIPFSDGIAASLRNKAMAVAVAAITPLEAARLFVEQKQAELNEAQKQVAALQSPSA